MLNKVLLILISTNILFACSSHFEGDTLLSVPVKSNTPIVGGDLQYYEDQLQRYGGGNVRHAVSQVWGGEYPDAQKSISFVEKRKQTDQIVFDVILIYDNVPVDDSTSSYRYDIQLKENSGNFEIIKLEESWRCWPDRGHRYFGVDPCK